MYRLIALNKSRLAATNDDGFALSTDLSFHIGSNSFRATDNRFDDGLFEAGAR